MKSLNLILVFFCKVAWCHAQNEPFTHRVVATGFNSAWEVAYGPNDSLWVTESKSYTIQRVNIINGAKTLLADIKALDPTVDLPVTGTQAQGGLMGLAIHPSLYSADPLIRSAKPWIYAVYVYKRNNCPGTPTSCEFSTRIVRFTYSANRLSSPQVILDNLPGSSDHNSGRLVIGPAVEPGADAAHTQYRLYYTIGDMGAGRALNTGRPQQALQINAFEGKVLRLNTESDGDAGADAWVPNDNPFYHNGTITPEHYVYSYGHRNAQGLAWGRVGGQNILYSSEQMDMTDDEVNIIRPGRNYGWDSVAGYCDGNVNGTRIGQTASANEQAYCSSHPDFTAPIFTMFTGTPAQIASLQPNDNTRWPTVALSSIALYGQDQIPGWNHSLLLTALKRDFIYRLKLNDAGTAVAGDTIAYFPGDGNRVRNITVAPDGLRIYVARDQGATANGGSIIEYTYSGAILPIADKPDPPIPVAIRRIMVYPNPASDALFIRLPPQQQKPFTLQLYTLTGVLASTTRFTNYSFSADVSVLSAGIYVAKLFNGYGVPIVICKIVKR